MLAAKGYPVEIPRSTWSVIGLLSVFVAFVVGGIVLLLVPDQTPYLPAYMPRFGLSDDTLRDILLTRVWRHPRFSVRHPVT